jgi:hypothetical protein
VYLCRSFFFARVAKLVDALVSEASGVTPIGVRLSSRAQKAQTIFSLGFLLKGIAIAHLDKANWIY